ncbi:MAG: hypothetical protein ACOC05_06930, partial [Oceanicaulis sp.]
KAPMDDAGAVPLRAALLPGRDPAVLDPDAWVELDRALQSLQGWFTSEAGLTVEDALIATYAVLTGPEIGANFKALARAGESRWIAQAAEFGLEPLLGYGHGQLVPIMGGASKRDSRTTPAAAPGDVPDRASDCPHRPAGPDAARRILPSGRALNGLVDDAVRTLVARITAPHHRDEDTANDCGLAADFEIEIETPSLLPAPTLATLAARHDGVTGAVYAGAAAGDLLAALSPSSGFCAAIPDARALETHGDFTRLSLMLTAWSGLAPEADRDPRFGGWWREAGSVRALAVPVYVDFDLGAENPADGLVIRRVVIAAPPHPGAPFGWPDGDPARLPDSCRQLRRA